MRMDLLGRLTSVNLGSWTVVLDATPALDQGDPSAYVNFLGEEGPDRVRAAYPGTTWDRLAGVKARYDPDNFFRLNQNVRPAARPADA